MFFFRKINRYDSNNKLIDSSDEITPTYFRYELLRLRKQASTPPVTLASKSQNLAELTDKIEKIQAPYEKRLE